MVENTGKKVEIRGMGLIGWITKVRFDDAKQAIYTVLLDDPNATPDGIFYARAGELVWL